MPVKRRLRKSRRNLDGMTLQDLFYGPGTCLFNGEGYLGPFGDGFFHDKPKAVQANVLAEMRDDWERHSATIMAAWNARTDHDLYIAREYHGAPKLPWAATEFGDAECR